VDLRPAWLIDLGTPLPDPSGLGAEAVAFIETLILPDGQPFRLVPEQRRIVEKVFGDVDSEGWRNHEVLYLHLPSGNAKSTLAAAICLTLLAHPRFRIPNGQCVIAAATREQARSTSFGIIQGFIERMFPDEAERALRFRVVSNAVSQEIEHLPSGSTLRVLSRAPSAQEGLSVYCLLAEETHVWAQQADRLWDVLRKSQAKITAASPLAMIATTAGVGVGGVGHRLYSIAKDVASGKVDNPSWCPIIYEADPDEDWRDPLVWSRVNFGLGTFKSMRTLRNLALEAETSATARAEFLRYHLNRWAEGVGEPWIDLAVYDRAAQSFDLETVRHFPCFIAVDAGQTSDLTAVVALFADVVSRRLYVVPSFWCPAESIAKRSEMDSVPYLEWAEDKLIVPTDGASIDERVIEAKIRELAAEYDVQAIGFDPWQTRRMMSRLLEDGLPVVEIPQHYRTMSPAMKATEKAILDGRLIHAGHAVLRWCFGNVPLPVPDPNGNVKPNKSRSRSLKIDGAVATIMTVFLAEVGEEESALTFESITGLPSRGAEESANGR
jgi:phage terminase large subunit-like protein